MVNDKLVKYWKEQLLISDSLKKTSLQFWNPNIINYYVCSQIWESAGSDTVSVHTANIHVKLSSDTYIYSSKEQS